MKFLKIHLPLFILLIGLSFCTVTNQIRTFQVEILKPGIFEIPEGLSVAVMNRDLLRSDTSTFYYSSGYLRLLDTANDTTEKNHAHFNMVKDTSIKYQNLSDTCVNSLIRSFEEDGYFSKVVKPSDSLKLLLSFPDSIKAREELFEQTESDVCIFLDYFNLSTTYNNHIYFVPFITRAELIWTVVFKNDSLAYAYKFADTLYFDQEQVNEYSKYKEKTLGILLNNSCKYLGRSFGTKVVPSWVQVDRMYYKSHNPEMLKAEKLALNMDWLKAAEIWKKETKNKNKEIAAKASYNMALACEMEGNLDPAMDWLVKSYKYLEKNNEVHWANCQRYLNILVTRKKEIERLDKQIGSTEYSTEN